MHSAHLAKIQHFDVDCVWKRNMATKFVLSDFEPLPHLQLFLRSSPWRWARAHEQTPRLPPSRHLAALPDHYKQDSVTGGRRRISGSTCGLPANTSTAHKLYTDDWTIKNLKINCIINHFWQKSDQSPHQKTVRTWWQCFHVNASKFEKKSLN